MFILQKDYLEQLMYMSEGITAYAYPEIYGCVEKMRWKYVPTALIHEGTVIDRVRIHRKPTERYYTYKDISYIHDPKKFISINFGRANQQCQPVFYGAITTDEIEVPRAVAYMETTSSTLVEANNPDFKETFTLSRWVVTKEIEVAEIIFSDDAVKVSSTVRRSLENQLPKIQNHPYGNYFLAQARFFSNEFAKAITNAPNDYFITSAFANYVWRSTHLKGITYPSVQSLYKGQNVALLPGIVDRHLKLDTVAVFESTYESPGKLIVDSHEVAYEFGKQNMNIKYAPMKNDLILPYNGRILF